MGTSKSGNTCNRCGRALKDPGAAYGWRCAIVMGADGRQVVDLNATRDKLEMYTGFGRLSPMLKKVHSIFDDMLEIASKANPDQDEEKYVQRGADLANLMFHDYETFGYTTQESVLTHFVEQMEEEKATLELFGSPGPPYRPGYVNSFERLQLPKSKPIAPQSQGSGKVPDGYKPIRDITADNKNFKIAWNEKTGTANIYHGNSWGFVSYDLKPNADGSVTAFKNGYPLGTYDKKDIMFDTNTNQILINEKSLKDQKTTPFIELIPGREKLDSSLNSYKRSDFELNQDEYNERFNTLKNQYGFSDIESDLVLKAEKIFAKYVGNDISPIMKAQKTNALLASLSGNYGGYNFDSTAGVVSQKEAKQVLIDAGMTEDEVRLFTGYKDHDGKIVKGFLAEQASNKEGFKDYPHEKVVIASLTNKESAKHNIVNLFMGGDLDNLSGYKGDIVSGKISDNDIKADLDAYNIDKLLKNNKSIDPNVLIYDYYRKIDTKEINRSEMFISFWGNGNIEKGIKKLQKEVDGWSTGSEYLSENNIIENVRNTATITALTSGNSLIDPQYRKYVMEEARKMDEEKNKKLQGKQKAKEDFFNYLYSDLGW